jgi:hypothetical protein
VFFFCLQAPFTGGEDGIQSVPRRAMFGMIDTANDMTMYYVVLAIFVIGWLALIFGPASHMRVVYERGPARVSAEKTGDEREATPTVTGSKLATGLTRLSGLRERGLLTDDEFAQAKRHLLDAATDSNVRPHIAAPSLTDGPRSRSG